MGTEYEAVANCSAGFTRIQDAIQFKSRKTILSERQNGEFHIKILRDALCLPPVHDFWPNFSAGKHPSMDTFLSHEPQTNFSIPFPNSVSSTSPFAHIPSINRINSNHSYKPHIHHAMRRKYPKTITLCQQFLVPAPVFPQLKMVRFTTYR